MKESVLRDYFNNKIPVELLAADVKNTQTKVIYDSTYVHVDQIDDGTSFEIKKKHILKLCIDALTGNLNAEDINSIALALVFSEYFVWDNSTPEGKIIGNIIHDWESPEINSPITIINMEFWKEYLETGEYNLTL